MACIIDKCQTLGSTLCLGGAAFASGLSEVAQTGSAVFCQGAKITAGFLSNGANAIAGVALSALAALAVCLQGQAMIAAGFFAMHQAFLIPLVIGAAIPVAIFLIAAIATSCLKGNESAEHEEALRLAQRASADVQAALALEQRDHDATRILLGNEQDALLLVRNEIAALRNAEEDLRAENVALQGRLLGSRDAVQQARAQISELKSEIASLKANKGSVGGESEDGIANLQAQLGKALGEVDVKVSQFKDLEDEHKRALGHINELERQLDEKQREIVAREQAFHELSKDFTASNDKIKEHSAALDLAREAMTAQDNDIDLLGARLKEQEEKFEGLQMSFNEASKRNETLAADLEQAGEEIVGLKDRIEQLKNQISKAIEDKEAAEEQAEALNQQLIDQSARLKETLESHKAELESKG
ncbi:MAG TPA: hypothetical protein DCE71_04860 [Parachlamydiales bacterium]|nr:hypothetical protein [Parachlamydiales bacterium]